MAFPPNSRYQTTPTATLTDASGQTIVYLTRRFVPQPSSFALLHVHTVVASDRLDNLAATELGDPELFWRICDANGALRPDDLVVVGRALRITLPVGIPAAPHG